MDLTTTEREAALSKMEKIADLMQTCRGNSHAQRTGMLQLSNLAHKAGVAPWDWAEEYFKKKVSSAQEQFYCKGCNRNFSSLLAYNGHGPSKCQLNAIKGKQNEKRS